MQDWAQSLPRFGPSVLELRTTPANIVLDLTSQLQGSLEVENRLARRGGVYAGDLHF
jgi:hypothetical protein